MQQKKDQTKKAKIKIILLVWSSKNVKNKEWICRKNCRHYLCLEGKKRHFRAHYLFWPNFSYTTKIVVNWAKPKMTPFFEKCFFGMGEKVAVTNCVFQKLCSAMLGALFGCFILVYLGFKGPTSPNPSFFWCFCVCVFIVFVFCGFWFPKRFVFVCVCWIVLAKKTNYRRQPLDCQSQSQNHLKTDPQKTKILLENVAPK